MNPPDRVQRLIRLLNILQSGRTFSATELAGLCQVSRRTFYRDIKMLNESGVPVQCDEGGGGYSLSKNYYLPPMDLQLDETLSLILLCQERGIPFQSSAREASLKLLSNLPKNLQDEVCELASTISVHMGVTGSMPESVPHFERILHALSDRCNLRIKYDSFAEKKQISTLCSPYRLLFSRRSWYMIGRSSLHREVRMFHVGRVLDSELVDQPYEIPTSFSLEKFIGNAWHLIRNPQENHRVVVRFQPMVARNVAEVNWHKTQKLNWNDDGTLDYTVQVEGLSEILWWVLGYGDKAEVLQPPELRKMVVEHINNMVTNYSECRSAD